MYIGLKVRVKGDPKKAQRLTSKQFWRRAVVEVRDKVLRAVGEEYIKQLREAIESGDVSGPALSEAWAARKEDNRPWIDLEDLVNALAVVEVGDGKYHAGIPRGTFNTKGQPLDIIAATLEIGTVLIPPRRVFEPVAERVVKDQAFIGYQIEKAMQKVII